MPTNEERREIAEYLRNSAIYAQLDYLEQFEQEIRDGISDGINPVRRDELLERLADLIEPEPERTCRKVPGRMRYGERKPKCSECGYSLGDPRWFYCPKCGGRIEE